MPGGMSLEGVVLRHLQSKTFTLVDCRRAWRGRRLESGTPVRRFPQLSG